tara:strand:+ start:237 stop:455 length:219 start_codon:yes stop_codon:yes gene_type:complete
MKGGVFTETKGKIKEGGLRTALKAKDTYKFTKGSLLKLLKNTEGDKFEFQGNKFTMTSKLRKQIQLALNMMK